MNDKFNKLAIYALVTEFAYIVWLFTAIRGVAGIIYLLLELALCLLLLLFVVNHWSRRYILSGGSYSLRGIVDVIIPTKSEPIEMLEKTIQAAKKITFPNIRFYIVDDSDNPQLKSLAKKYKFNYLTPIRHKNHHPIQLTKTESTIVALAL